MQGEGKKQKEQSVYAHSVDPLQTAADFSQIKHSSCNEPLVGSRTSERRVDEVLPVGAEHGVSKHQVQTAKQQVVRVHQVVSDHAEVPFKHT